MLHESIDPCDVQSCKNLSTRPRVLAEVAVAAVAGVKVAVSAVAGAGVAEHSATSANLTNSATTPLKPSAASPA